MAKGFKRKGKFHPTGGFKTISRKQEFMESGTVDGVKLDTRIKRGSNKEDVINWWEGMSVKERKEILDKHESSFFKNRDADSNFESLQFDIQRDLIDEFNREMS